MTWKAVYVLLLLAGSLAAQYQDLTTDRHGWKAAFSSALSLKGERRNDYPKLFEVDGSGALRTLRDEPVVINAGDRAPVNFPMLIRPEFSSDGTRMAFTGERWCIGGSGCVAVERTLGRVVWMDGSREAPAAGTARISANGRWAVYTNPTSLANPYRFYRLDFETGRSEFGRTGLSGMPGTGRRVVADDGTVVSVPGGRTMTVMKPGQPDMILELPFSAAAVTISTDGRMAVAETSDVAPMLWLVDLLARQTLPAVVAAEGVRQPALSDDGMTLMFLSGANWAAKNDSLAVQVWTMDLATGRLRQWSSEAAGVAEATIFGDGLVVWAVSRDGRLLRIDGVSGETKTVVGAAALLETPESAVWAPGSRYRLVGRGLKGASVRWQGMELSVAQSEDAWVEFLAPWDAVLGPGKLEVEGAESPFQAFQLTGEMRPVAPRFIKTDGFVHGLRADGSPLTLGNAAAPGELVTLLMRGLGPCDAEGRTLAQFEVTWEGSAALAVTGSRMDPWTAGTYRLMVRIPGQAAGPMLVSVKEAGREYAEESGWVAVY
jgi:uncharacterized protein (TIGR03437 family)